MNSEKVYLMILDGFGEGKAYAGNAIKNARMPNLNRLRKEYPLTLLQASGNAVGLPDGTQGGSEVGHFTIGAGRITYQYLEMIDRSIKDGSFFDKLPFLDAIKKVKTAVKTGEKAALHLLGMISDQGVHSHLNHLFALLELAKKHDIGQVYIHAITDGRDVPERTAAGFIEQIQKKIHDLGYDHDPRKKATIATIAGRFFTMDRDTNWDRTEKAYNLYALGEGIKETDPVQAINNAYARGVKTDYYIDPVILDEHGLIKDQDAVIFWNYRTDRTKQITQCFTGETQIGFKPKKTVRPFFVCFGDYSKTAPVVFPTQKIENNLGSVISQNKLLQLRIAETEKYAHVTYFFNSQVEAPFSNEERIMIDSPKPKSFAEMPEMSAAGIAERAMKELENGKYRLIVQNFANTDLVGHSGDYKATVTACEVVDECIGKIVGKAQDMGYHVILTADHGNAEYMVYEENGEPCPSHTTNPVICILISGKYKNSKLKNGRGLEDIAPTILNIMDIQKPAKMTGETLID